MTTPYGTGKPEANDTAPGWAVRPSMNKFNPMVGIFNEHYSLVLVSRCCLSEFNHSEDKGLRCGICNNTYSLWQDLERGMGLSFEYDQDTEITKMHQWIWYWTGLQNMKIDIDWEGVL